jgi:hypothetical protein
LLGAAYVRQEAANMGERAHPIAQRSEDEARAPLAEGDAILGAGRELVPMAQCAEDASLVLLDTLAKPDWVAADASRDRLDLLNEAGALSTGLDMADTIEARDSAERMLAHQLAVLHTSTLKIAAQLGKATNRLDVLDAKPEARAAANVEACRLVGALSRLATTYQSGIGTLQRLRTGGKQTVFIQHTHVSDGGQAVVASQFDGGGGRRKRGRGSK